MKALRAATLGLWALACASAHSKQAPQDKQNAQDSVYGDLYIATEPPQRSWEASLGYEGGLSNPYLTTNGLGLGASYTPHGALWFLGAESAFYFPKLNDFAHDLEREFGDQGFEAVISQPRARWFVNAGWRPLSGLLNWFSKSVTPFDVALSAGAGLILYKGEAARTAIHASLNYTGLIYGPLGFATGLRVVWEEVPGSGFQGSTEAQVRLILRF